MLYNEPACDARGALDWQAFADAARACDGEDLVALLTDVTAEVKRRCNVSDDRQHLHREDHPHTLAVFHALFARRLDRAVEIGFEATEFGAWVDWDRLTNRSWLSSTEIAVVHIAHGCAIAERHGGLGPHLRRVVVDTVAAVVG